MCGRIAQRTACIEHSTSCFLSRDPIPDSDGHGVCPPLPAKFHAPRETVNILVTFVTGLLWATAGGRDTFGLLTLVRPPKVSLKGRGKAAGPSLAALLFYVRVISKRTDK